jgi:peptidoglycan/LPS O-acetylase OafA/YrhL
MQEPNGQSAAELELRSLYRLPRSIPQLDRLRGLAILLVLMNHTKKAAPQYFDGILRQGWIGVDLFFVLSGFLITGILWESRGEKGYFKRFYVRRILRIWPVYLIILFLVFAIVPLIRHLSGLSAGTLLGEPYGVWAYLLFIQNLLGPALYYSPLLSITWSLAIEEQFYLVWPAILRICRRLIILPILLAGLSAAPLIRLIARHHGVSDIVIYICPFTHYDGLLCGAFVAIWLRSATPKRMTCCWPVLP